jgi:hypothetical protein
LKPEHDERRADDRGVGAQPHHEQEAHGHGRGEHGDPLGPPKEAVLRVIEQRQAEIADEPAEREQHDPPRELARAGRLHADEQEQQADADVREWGDERRRVDEVRDRLLLEEGALEVEDHPEHAHHDAADGHETLQRAPGSGLRPERHGNEQGRGDRRKNERRPFGLARVAVLGVRDGDVDAEERDIGDDEPLDAALRCDGQPLHAQPHLAACSARSLADSASIFCRSRTIS